MPRLSINELSNLTGRTRATVAKKLDGVEFKAGPRAAKHYDSKIALEKIYLAGNEDGESFVTAAEAQRQLTIARKEQIDLEMEVTRKERIPLTVIEPVNDRVFSNVAGILKAHRDKTMSEDAINDILSELRNVGSVLRHG